MKSSFMSFMAGGMLVLGVWMYSTTNKCKMDRLVKNVSETAEQMLQKFKGSNCGGTENCHCHEHSTDDNHCACD